MSLSTIERVLFLRGVALFSEIASEDLVYIARTCREEAIPRDNQFITQGDIGDGFTGILTRNGCLPEFGRRVNHFTTLLSICP